MKKWMWINARNNCLLEIFESFHKFLYLECRSKVDFDGREADKTVYKDYFHIFLENYYYYTVITLKDIILTLFKLFKENPQSHLPKSSEIYSCKNNRQLIGSNSLLLTSFLLKHSFCNFQKFNYFLDD